MKAAQKRDAIASYLKIDPTVSDRTIARKAGASHHPVSRVRKEMEQRGEIPHVPVRARMKYAAVARRLDAPPHGTYARYKSRAHRCRCDQCRQAKTEQARREHVRREARRLASMDVPHGVNGYRSWGCRCETCCTARSQKLSSDAGSRRLRALAGSEDVPHGVNGYRSWGCRCETCRNGHRERNRDQSRQPRNRRRRTARNDRSRDTATNHGSDWTGPELELVARYDYSALELSLLLGRTIHAVETMRGELKRDPCKQALAGTRTSRRRGAEGDRP